jgi:hypothetical protein
MNSRFTKLFIINALKEGFMGTEELSVRIEQNPLSVSMLADAKKHALRRRVWFRVLNRVERATIDLTVQFVDSIKSVKLAKMLTAIVDKLQSAIESTIDRLVRTIGVHLAGKISCVAAGWGNVSAKSWASDLSFAAFLATMHTSNGLRQHRSG